MAIFLKKLLGIKLTFKEQYLKATKHGTKCVSRNCEQSYRGRSLPRLV